MDVGLSVVVVIIRYIGLYRVPHTNCTWYNKSSSLPSSVSQPVDGQQQKRTTKTNGEGGVSSNRMGGGGGGAGEHDDIGECECDAGDYWCSDKGCVCLACLPASVISNNDVCIERDLLVVRLPRVHS